MKGIIVLDGPDGTGKTTLANVFKDIYGAHIIHSTWTPEKEEHMDRYHFGQLDAAEHISEEHNCVVIIDRLWLSDLCYSEVYRGGTDFIYHHSISEVLKSHNALNVVCLPDDNIRFEKHFNKLLTERDEMFTSGMLEVCDAFSYMYWGKMAENPFKDKEYIDQFADLRLQNDYIRYDLFEHNSQADIREFAHECVEKLIELRGEE